MKIASSFRRYVKLYFIFLKQFLKTQMQSKADFFIGFFSFFLNQLTGIIFLNLVFEQIPDLNGWNYYQLIFLYGYAQIPRGIDHFFANYLWIFTRKTVREGIFDRYLLRPANTLFQILVEQCCPDGIGEVLIGLILVIYSASHINISINVINVFWFIVSVVGGAVIFLAVKLFLAANTFFFIDAYQILYLGYNLSDFVKYPLDIYHKGISFILSFIIPFGFTAFIPASFFLTEDIIFNTIILELIVAAISFFLSYQYFLFGCKKYESTGS